MRGCTVQCDVRLGHDNYRLTGVGAHAHHQQAVGVEARAVRCDVRLHVLTFVGGKVDGERRISALCCNHLGLVGVD
jgi:hypothetical protein